jgi:hypothetical protein
MSHRPALLIAVVVTLSASALNAGEPQTLPEAQAQLRAALAQARDERAAQAAKPKAAQAAPRRLADLSCKPQKPGPGAREALTGVIDLDSLSLENSRSGGATPLIAQGEPRVVDGRCGALLSPLKDNLNYYVTPRHYWGEDILQLPKAAPSSAGKPFTAYLHTCQYDGEWHADWDAVLDCTLTPR